MMVLFPSYLSYIGNLSYGLYLDNGSLQLSACLEELIVMLFSILGLVYRKKYLTSLIHVNSLHKENETTTDLACVNLHRQC